MLFDLMFLLFGLLLWVVEAFQFRTQVLFGGDCERVPRSKFKAKAPLSYMADLGRVHFWSDPERLRLERSVHAGGIMSSG